MAEFDIPLLKSAIRQFLPLGRSGLLPSLHAAQNIYGWIPREVASEIASELKIPLADLHGVIEFYNLFYNKPVGKKIVRVCTDPVCALKGSDQILKHFCAANQTNPGQTNFDKSITIEHSTCLGLCDLAPAATINNMAATNLPQTGEPDTLSMPVSQVYGSHNLLTRHCAGNKSTTLIEYGTYAALQRALLMRPDAVINEVKVSGLVGRGGAAFPTGVKLEGAYTAEGTQKYIICNADESEPGTFKDRILLAYDPHLIIEGMCIAAHAIGANKGYIFLRGEYSYLLPGLELALSEAREAGYLNNKFDVEIRLGAGAYICGEETALFEAIEGKRGLPRIKPPFPTTSGLFGAPTVINNVETLCNLPVIFEIGAEAYHKIGTEKSPGSKLFCLSGDIARPGLYEIPFGHTLRELLHMAGGLINGRSLQAVLLGGAAGTFATSAQLDIRLTFEDLRKAGLSIGSGVVMVFDDTRDLRDTLKRLGQFFAHESCGKCYPCQLGTQRQKEILERIADGKIEPGDTERLKDIGWTMTDASLCGLGQTAAAAVISALDNFPHLFLADNSAN